jgi:hypothetical protein
MSDYTLTADATIMCPHGGTITAVPSSTNVTAGGAVLVQSDTFIVAGCPFTLPGGVYNPCTQVQWVVANLRCTVDGTPTLSRSSTGMCIGANGAPQGTVSVISTQARAKST